MPPLLDDGTTLLVLGRPDALLIGSLDEPTDVSVRCRDWY
jgi:hypothetical protein